MLPCRNFIERFTGKRHFRKDKTVLRYIEENGGYTIKGYNGTKKEIVIPDFIADKPVLALRNKSTDGGNQIYNPVFSEKITNVYFGINSQLATIDRAAFWGCSGLTSIKIPDSVTTIEGNAFMGCSSLASIEIPTSVTTIAARTFFACSGLTSIKIPASVTYIGDTAFSGCMSLTSIEIPNSVASFGKNAFENCTSLTNIIFGENSRLSFIGDYAFNGCGNLKNIDIPSGVTNIGKPVALTNFA